MASAFSKLVLENAPAEERAQSPILAFWHLLASPCPVEPARRDRVALEKERQKYTEKTWILGCVGHV